MEPSGRNWWQPLDMLRSRERHKHGKPLPPLRAVPIGARSSRSNRGRLISVVHLIHEEVARREVDALLAAVVERERA